MRILRFIYQQFLIKFLDMFKLIIICIENANIELFG